MSADMPTNIIMEKHHPMTVGNYCNLSLVNPEDYGIMCVFLREEHTENMVKRRMKAASTAKVKKPRILIVTPEITYLPEGMGNLAGKMSAKAGGMADVSASLVGALFDLGADVHVALPHYRRLFHEG